MIFTKKKKKAVNSKAKKPTVQSGNTVNNSQNGGNHSARNGNNRGQNVSTVPQQKSKQPSRQKQPAPPRKPVDKRTEKAMSEAMNKRKAGNSKKKRGYRGGNYVLYYILGAIVVAVVLIVLSNTVLFRCTDISVSGNVRYKAEEIISKSGLEKGNNLLHINEKLAEDSVLNSLVYLDSVDVQKAFPTKINIVVTEAEQWFCVKQGGVTAAVSRRGRIIEQGTFAGLTLVTGYEPESIEPGSWLKSTDEGKSELPYEIFEAAEKVGLTDITEINLSDKFAVQVVVDGRITLNLGTATEIESKLRVAHKLVESEIGKQENVTVTLTNPEKVAVKTNPVPASSSSSSSSKPVVPDVSEASGDTAEGTSEDTGETYSEEAYDAYGADTYEEPYYSEDTYDEGYNYTDDYYSEDYGGETYSYEE